MASSALIQRVRYQASGIGTALPKIIAAITAINLIFLGWRAADAGVAAAINNVFNCTLLLTTLLAAAAGFSRHNRQVLGLDTFLIPTALVIQFGAFATIYSPMKPPTLPSWHVVHQLSLVVSAAFFITGGLAGAVYLILVRALRHKETGVVLGRFAPLESWERLGRWCTLLGFSLFTFGILTGICQAVQLQQRQHQRANWLTDTFILICFALWAAYALGLLATWLVPSFRGKKAAYLATGTGFVLVGLFLAINWLSVAHQ